MHLNSEPPLSIAGVLKQVKGKPQYSDVQMLKVAIMRAFKIKGNRKPSADGTLRDYKWTERCERLVLKADQDIASGAFDKDSLRTLKNKLVKILTY